MSYADLIERKRERLRARDSGITVADIHPRLFPFQREITIRALARGRVALFEECGMGKTLQEIEWARHVADDTGQPVLIITPLAVAHQMRDEGALMGIDVALARTQSDVGDARIAATNYEMIHHFDADAFGGVVLDESSILKNAQGEMRRRIVEFVSHAPYRLAATATPAPNELIELLNHAEYLGIMSVKEALALWFTQDGNSTQHWRLKGHARADFWAWVGSWAIAARDPASIGYPMEGYDLPPIETIVHTVESEYSAPQGQLFATRIGVQEMRRMRRATLAARVARCAEIVNASDDPWVVWCELNDESAALAAAIPDAVEVRGSDDPDTKIERLRAFSEGRVRVIVTKPSIAGHGLNWQHCAHMAFTSASYSFEATYQAVRRCWRFGQSREVEVHMIGAGSDQVVHEVTDRKAKLTDDLYDSIPWQIEPQQHRQFVTADVDVASGENWTLWRGDSVETIANVEDNTVGLSVFSPPFPGMYVYTDSPHDMGNVADIAEMIDQFRYLMDFDHLGRVLMPGRSVFVHITQAVAQVGRDGYMGMKDFRGEVIAMMSSFGWTYYGEVTIDKNPQVKAIRTRDSGLQFKSLANDAARMHPALADMLLQFRKPGDNPTPIRAGRSERYGNTAGWVTNEDWITWARPVWYADDYEPQGPNVPGIRETDVLNVSAARSERDERHLAPLQLEVIRRCVRVWSNPGEVVYSPFAGVGSEGVVALREGRRFVGGELNHRYWETARRNLEAESAQGRLL